MTETIDNWTETVNGVRFSVQVVPDYDANPKDADCYSDADIGMWKLDAWRFVGVIVAVDIDGIEPSWADASLWGVQYGTGDGWYVGRTELLEYPIGELADEAMCNLDKIGQRLTDAVAARDAAIAAWQAASAEVTPS